MPWLPLAILLVAALTIASLALILFPPGEGGEQVAEQVAEDDITVGVDSEANADDLADDADDGATGANLAPPPPEDDPPLRVEDDADLAESEPSPALTRRDETSGA